MAFELHKNNELWPEDFWADGEIFRELALPPLNELPPATSVQNITPPSDATARNAVEDTAAIPITANDCDFSYIFNESGYRINHGFSPKTRLESPSPLTGLTLLRDHLTHPTATKLVVRIHVRTYDRCTYEWSVKFSAQNPFKAFNRDGEFKCLSRCGQVVSHAFCEAINSIIDFTNDSQNRKPPISTIYVRAPRFQESKYALRRLLCDVQEGKTCPVPSEPWVQDMYIGLSKTLVKMRKLRAEGVNILLWQTITNIKKRRGQHSVVADDYQYQETSTLS